MNNSTTARTLSALAIVVTAAVLFAGQATAGSKDTITMNRTQLDLNKDGMVSENELEAYVKMLFLKMDRNSDQLIDDSEFVDGGF